MMGERRKLLFVGDGDAGREAINGTIKKLNSIDKTKDHPVYDLYISHSSQRDAENVYDIVGGYKPDYELIEPHPIPRVNFKNRLSVIRDETGDLDFDYIMISAGRSYDEKEYKEIGHQVEDAIRTAGFDLDNEDYRYRDLINNWKTINDLAEIFRDYEVKGLVDIFTNPPDPFAYLWASITGQVDQVMGDNHLDTFRLRTSGGKRYKSICDLLGENVEDKPANFLTATAWGYHGGGIVPILKGYKAVHPFNNFEPLKDSPEIYEYIKDWLINFPKTLGKDKHMILRTQILESTGEIIEALFDPSKTVEMAVFQKLNDIGFLKRCYPKELDFEDKGLFIGYGTRFISTDEGFFPRPVQPPKEQVSDHAAIDFIQNYKKLHSLIDALVDKELIGKHIEHDTSYREEHPLRSPISFRTDILTSKAPQPEIREARPTLHYINSDEVRNIYAVELPDMKKLAQYQINSSTGKHNEKLSPEKMIFSDNHLLIAADYMDKHTEWLWFDLHQKVDGFLRPINKRVFDLKGMKVQMLCSEKLNHTAQVFDGEVYFILRRQNERAKIYSFDPDRTEEDFYGEGTGNEHMISLAALDDTLIVGGMENIYYMHKGRLREKHKARCKPMMMQALTNERIVMYGDHEQAFAFKWDSNQDHRKLDYKVFDLYQNGDFMIVGYDGRIEKKVCNNFEDISKAGQKMDAEDIVRKIIIQGQEGFLTIQGYRPRKGVFYGREVKEVPGLERIITYNCEVSRR